MNKYIMPSRTRQRGQLGPLLIILTVIIGMVSAALAIDFSHMSTVRTELQNATDAAALAGAQDLWFDKSKCAPDALALAAMNYADGRAVANGTQGLHVDVTVTNPQPNIPGKVQVDAYIDVHHMFAPFFEHWTDRIEVSSTAGTQGKLWRLAAGQAFPMAVSLDAVPTDHKGNILGPALKELRPGDTVTFYIGSQSMKNATFTTLTSKSANADAIDTMIDKLLGNDTKKDISIPSVAKGEDIYLNNGVMGLKDLAKEPRLSALKAEEFLILPIINGDPAYNQTAKVVGFTALQVTKIEANPMKGVTIAITGTLMN
ncbi:MAG: hypothetical protein K2X27_15975, partial [Candidatus Obscuribacterales bacterium]|nr:hypothetical protein [Candidatus Obscuribacterales bacterium]